MAGDWIKMESSLPDKPEVWAIAAELNIDPDAVVGKLFRVWTWFDEQTESGNAPSVTKMLLDRRVGVNGFCEAMIKAEWMHDDGQSITLPNFDRHNGKTAKNRALTAKRVANHKKNSNGPGNATSVSSALPREEKRREEEKPPSNSPRKAKRKADALPEGLPDSVSADLWRDFVKHRRAIKKPMTDEAVTRLVAKLNRMASNGHDPGAALENSIVNGWQGVFEPKPGEATTPASQRRASPTDYVMTEFD